MFRQVLSALLIAGFFSFSQALAREEASYGPVALKQMPLGAQAAFEGAFKRLALKRVLVGPKGSERLGINMLFTDPFFVSKVAVKYNIRGDYQFNKVYKFDDYRALHFQFNGVPVALIYQKLEDASAQRIKKLILERMEASVFFAPVSSAQADECYRPEFSPGFDIDTQVSEGASSAMIADCFSSMGEGAHDSTIGMAKGAWKAISEEASKFMASPATRMSDYVDYVGTGLGHLWQFTQTVSKMLLDPVYGSRLLKQKFGEVGDFFAQAYHNVKDLPFAAKADILCHIIGAIGVDALIVGVTAGAAGAKLATSFGRLFLKLKRVSSIMGRGMGRGVSYSFKTLSELGQDSISRLKKILDSGKKPLLERRLREAGCAI